MRRIHRDIVSALIFSKDGKLFLGKKDPSGGGVYLKCWHLPGGAIEKDEDKITALKREVKEETQIDIKSYKIELIDDSGQGQSEKILKYTREKVICEMTFNVFKVVVDDKNSNEIKVKLNDDLIEYTWIDLDWLDNLLLTPPSIKLFRKLGYIT